MNSYLSQHDQVVQSVVTWLCRAPYLRPSIGTFANEPQRTQGLSDGVTTFFPDVVEVDFSTWKVSGIVEVETVASMSSAIHQFVSYDRLARLHNCDLILIVPAGYGYLTRSNCQLYGLTNVKAVFDYELRPNGVVLSGQY
jgi:hypothetical protein